MALLTERLHQWALKQDNKIVFSYLNDAGDVIQSLTYKDLSIKSHFIGKTLISQGIKRGDRVLLVYPPSLDFIIAFLACIQYGIIAVPTFPPDPSRLSKDLAMFTTIAKSSGATVALTSTLYNYATKVASIKNLFSGSTSAWPELQWIVTDAIPVPSNLSLQDVVNNANLTENDIAFLQYTSGSTSEPKGVMITHGNLAHNLQLIITGLKADTSTVVVSWLPQYHDMGLIGSYLGIVFCGGSGFYMSPYSFIRNPSLWIQAMSQYRATHMQAPNFAYALTARKFLALLRSAQGSIYAKTKLKWVDDLDLSSVKHMINAAEPVEAASIDIFYAVFGKYGLPNGVIYPTYGLAEHTVYVCSNGRQRLTVEKVSLERDGIVRLIQSDHNSTKENNSAIVIIGCGRPSDSESVDLKIIDASSRSLLPEDRVGEIWIKSKSRAAGYWGLQEKTKEDFDAAISLDLGEASVHGGGEAGFLRTGDLGFLHNGEIFICGREKDLIIIRGRNHYPQDIERTCEGLFTEHLRGGCSAAFSIPFAGQELLVYAAEITDSRTASGVLQQLVDDIRSTVSREHGVSPSVILLLEPRTIFKTTSGKIARQWVRKGYFASSLKAVYTWSSLDSANEEAMEAAIAPVPSDPSTTNSEAIDPVGKSLNEVLAVLKEAVATCVGSSPSSMKTNVPLVSLGMDSMMGVQLQGILETKFTVPIPEEIMFERDATLETIANSLIRGGIVKERPVLLKIWEVVDEGMKREAKSRGKSVKGAHSPEWFRKFEVKGHVDTLRFPNGSGSEVTKMSPADEFMYATISFMFYGVFILIPLLTGIACILFPWKMVGLVLGVLILVNFTIQAASKVGWPPAFRAGNLCLMASKYFSYRVVLETKFDTSSPSIYAMSPHGIFGIAPAFLAVINEYINGENFHIGGAGVVFYVPIYGLLLKLIGFIDVSKKSLKATLEKGRSVGLIPGGIAEMFVAGEPNETLIVRNRKGFIRLALETGSQIIPVYTFGQTSVFKTKKFDFLEKLSRSLKISILPFWGRWGLPIPFRTPLVTVLGRPIQVPKVADPSPELVNEYYETYLREIRRVYDRFKHIYNWEDRALVLKR